MFVSLEKKKILVVGGGKIACRRVKTLLKFHADIHVTAPELCGELSRLENEQAISVSHRPYRPGDIKGADLVIAATDVPDVNMEIWKECRAEGILVNVSHDKSLCDFYFPSVVVTDDVVVAVNSGGSDPSRVRKTRKKIQEMFDEGGF